MLLSFILLLGLLANDPSGSWKGTMNAMGTEFPLVFHIEKTDAGYAAKMDSPNQGVYGVAASSMTFTDGKVQINFPNIMANYTGVIKGKQIEGTWMQGGQSFALNLSSFIPEKKKEEKIEIADKSWIGSWQGNVTVNNMNLQLRLNIAESGISIEFPGQGGGQVKPSGHEFSENSLQVMFNAIASKLDLTKNEGQLVGTFNRVGQALSITLSKVE